MSSAAKVDDSYWTVNSDTYKAAGVRGVSKALEGDLRVNMQRLYSRTMRFGRHGIRWGAQKAPNGPLEL